MMQKLLTYFTEAWHNRQRGRIALCCLGLVAIIALAAWMVSALLLFLASKFDVIMLVGGGTFVAWYCIYATNLEKKQKAAVVQKQMDEAEQLRQQQLQNRNYDQLCIPLFTVLRSVGAMLGFQPPEQPKRLHHASKVIPCGSFAKYRYEVLRIGEVTPATACAVLQQELDSRIQSGELGLATQKHPYKGSFYSILQVMGVEDVGTVCYIDLAIASDEVCAYLESREYVKLDQKSSIFADTKDRVF